MDEEDSRIDIALEANESGSRIVLRDPSVPFRLKGFEDGGWQENYFDPMSRYFS